MNVAAPAKINLYLKVTARRPDGFHELATLMHAVTLADEVDLEPAPPGGGLVFSCEVPELAGDDNLAVRAARLWAETFGTAAGLRLQLTKRIPWGAGLGGGSSDAAAVLRGLARRDGRALTDPRVAALAARLGSDVPFFLGGGCAWATGRGEALAPLTPWPGLGVVILKPAYGVPTAAAYRRLRVTLPAATVPLAAVRPGWENRDPGVFAALAHNDFEAVVFADHPELARWCEALIRAGAWRAGLSGSGSAVFGLFPTAAAATVALAALALPPGVQRWSVTTAGIEA